MSGGHWPDWLLRARARGLRAFARVNPEMHAVAALKAVLFRGGDLAAASAHVGFLAVFTVVMLLLSTVTMKRTL